jgi:hypothetical protein
VFPRSSPIPRNHPHQDRLRPLQNHEGQSYMRALPTNDDAWTNAPSPLPCLPHIPVPHLHTHPHGHGHYYHHTYNAAPLVGHTGGDRERRLRVRVRQIRDVLLTSASPVSASGSGVTSVTATAAAAPTPSRRRSRIEAGAGAGTTDMDVDVDTDDGDEAEAEAEVETDCLTSRAPSRAASPPLRQRRLAVHSGALEAVGLGLEAEAPLVGRAGSCCSRWAIRSLRGPVGRAGSSSG